ncbi:MAG: transposase [Sellimonas intestinalis]|uniref:transposase n=1 Tax=Sellimonas intestinalis TaxID=1653434 RepID=UPI003994086B
MSVTTEAELRHIRTEKKEQDGYTQTIEVYGCADCSGCEHKSKCLYRYKEEKPDREKVMKINERWEELKEESNRNIQSEKGILNRQIRSIQTEAPLWRYQGERKLPPVPLSFCGKSI